MCSQSVENTTYIDTSIKLLLLLLLLLSTCDITNSTIVVRTTTNTAEVTATTVPGNGIIYCYNVINSDSKINIIVNIKTTGPLTTKTWTAATTVTTAINATNSCWVFSAFCLLINGAWVSLFLSLMESRCYLILCGLNTSEKNDLCCCQGCDKIKMNNTCLWSGQPVEVKSGRCWNLKSFVPRTLV